ncbi:MAG: ABC transporter ATP-binding protein [Acidimicrobiia bacterium]
MIRVEHLTKRFGDTVAVNDLSFEIRPGAVTGFLGPNGAGKSTTMRCIVGLDRPTSGTALVGGRRYATLKRPAEHVGSILDLKAFHAPRTARNHLKVMATLAGVPRKRADEVLELVGLSEVADVRAGRFSLGMGQRLSLATALLGRPNVLILDEPLNGLDPEGIHWMRSVIRGHAGGGGTVFVSSHLLSEMAELADDLVVIGKGALIASGPIGQFISANTTSTVRVVSPQLAELMEAFSNVSHAIWTRDKEAVVVAGIEARVIGERAASLGIVLHELTPMQATLEQAYFDVTRNAVEFGSGDGT